MIRKEKIRERKKEIKMGMWKEKGPIWIEGERGRVEGSRIELARNILILGQFHYTLPPSPSIQTDHKLCLHGYKQQIGQIGS